MATMSTEQEEESTGHICDDIVNKVEIWFILSIAGVFSIFFAQKIKISQGFPSLNLD